MVLPFFLCSERPEDVEVSWRPLDDDLIDKGTEELPARVQVGIAVDGIQELGHELMRSLGFQSLVLFAGGLLLHVELLYAGLQGFFFLVECVQPVGNFVDGQATLVEVKQAGGGCVNLVQAMQYGIFSLGIPAALLLSIGATGCHDCIELLRV